MKFDLNKPVINMLTGERYSIAHTEKQQQKNMRVVDAIMMSCLSPEIAKEARFKDYNLKLNLYNICAKADLSARNKENVQYEKAETDVIKLCMGMTMSVEICAFIQVFFDNPEKTNMDKEAASQQH